MKIGRKKYLKYVLGAAVALILPAFVFIKSSNFSSWVFVASAPLVKAENNIRGFFGSIFAIKQIARENFKLKKENLELAAENIRLKEAERENFALKSQLNMPVIKERKTVKADVSGFDPFSYNNFMTINKGGQSGIKEGMPVLLPEGVLLGKIEEVRDKFSKVMLIFSSRSVIAVTTQESRSSGALKGSFGTSLIADAIPQYEEIKEGEMVITSALGGNIPKGIPVGTVDKIISSPNEIFKKASINAFADPDKAEEVIVILD